MRAYIHSTAPITERAMQVIKAAKESAGITTPIQLAELGEEVVPHPNVPVLSLGAYERRGTERVVMTYSVPQIMVKADTLTVLGRALRNLTNKPELPMFRYELVESIEQLRSLKLRGTRLVVDIETRGNVDAQVPDWNDLISLAIYDGHTAYVLTERMLRSTYRADIIEVLTRYELIAHNGKFDFKYLSYGDSKLLADIDTMMMHYSLFPAASNHDLKNLAMMYLDAPDWDSEIKKYTRAKTYTEWTDLGDGAYAQAMKYPANSGYERIPRTLLYEYNAYDVYYTWFLEEILVEQLESSESALKVYNHLMELSEVYQTVESGGVRYDVEYMRALQQELDADGERLESELCELVGYTMNPRSPKQVMEYFQGAGLRLPDTGADTLAGLVAEGNEVAAKILEIRDNSKMNGTYITGYLNKLIGDRGYPGFKLHASSTGRLGGAGPSMLTIPRNKRVKRMVLPDEGHVIAAADLSQAELRVMAMESGDQWMIDAFAPDAGDFFDLLMESTYQGVDAAELARTNLQEYTDLRAKFKGVVYGTSFGRGARAIGVALGISEDEAQELVDGYVRPGSAFAQWRDDISYRAVNGLPIVNPLGRHFQAELVTSRNRQNVINSALSFMSQSTANDICLKAMIGVSRDLPAEARLMGSIHDAIYVSTPLELAWEVGELIGKHMRDAGEAIYGLTVPFVAEAEFGHNLADLKEWEKFSA